MVVWDSPHPGPYRGVGALGVRMEDRNLACQLGPRGSWHPLGLGPQMCVIQRLGQAWCGEEAVKYGEHIVVVMMRPGLKVCVTWHSPSNHSQSLQLIMRKMKPGLALPPTHTHTHTQLSEYYQESTVWESPCNAHGRGWRSGWWWCHVSYVSSWSQTLPICQGLTTTHHYFPSSLYNRGCSWGSSASFCSGGLSCSLGQAVLRAEVRTKRAETDSPSVLKTSAQM